MGNTVVSIDNLIKRYGENVAVDHFSLSIEEGGMNQANTDEEGFDYRKYDISEKEFEVIQLVAEGFSNKEISQKLFLSEGTVRNYLSTILEKLNLRDRTQLAIFYLKHE